MSFAYRFPLLYQIWRRSMVDVPTRKRAARTMGLAIACVGLFWMVVGWVIAVPMVFWLSALMAVSSISSIGLGVIGWENAARILWFWSAMFVVAVAYLFIHSDGGIDQLYTAVAAGVFLNCSTRTEKPLIVFLLLSAFVFWVTGRMIGPGYFGPLVVDHIVAQTVVAPLVTGTTLIVVALNVGVFAVMAERYNDDMEIARREAEAANRSKSEFLATMSHEIRTPMNGVIGMADILAATDLKPQQQRNLNTIRDSALSLLRIIEDILDMSSIEAGKLQLVEEPMVLAEVIEGTLDTLRPYGDQHNVMVHLSLAPDLPAIVRGDSGRLRQIVLNLLGNGIKFSRRPKDEAPGNARLSVDMDEQGQVCLVFADDGIGIAPDFLSHLYEPFGRSEMVTTRRFGGTGLGLAIVHQLVGKMGGSIAVDSTPGNGAIFTVRIPLAVLAPAIAPPDLSGVAVVLAGLSDWQAVDWARVLEGTGASLLSVPLEGVEATLAALGKGSVLVLSDFNADGTEDISRNAALSAVLPGQRAVVMTRDRSRSSGVIDRAVHQVQSLPMLRSEALGAILAMAAGSGAGEIAALPAVMAPNGAAPEQAQPPGDGIRILVAEDNEINQVVLATQLERLGHAPVLADDGLAALALWQTQGFDLVLTDCHMPNMDGFGLTEAIRREEGERGLKPIPIIAVTANAQAGEGDRCIVHGMTGYLAKPVRVADLRRLIDSVLAARNG